MVTVGQLCVHHTTYHFRRTFWVFQRSGSLQFSVLHLSSDSAWGCSIIAVKKAQVASPLGWALDNSPPVLQAGWQLPQIKHCLATHPMRAEDIPLKRHTETCFIGRCFWGFVLPVFEYCPVVWCSAADTHLKLLDRVVSGACFLAGGVLNCNLSHRRTVAVLCMLYKIRCNLMHPLCGALPVPYVPVRVTCGTLISHRYTHAPPRCRTWQYRRTFIPLSVSIWNDLVDPVFDGVGLAGFKSRSNTFLLA